jgi:chromosome segregation ATPase
MNDDELQSLIVSNYENDAQTLTSDTEANLLKFKELIGQLGELDQQRWDAIKKTFQQNVKMRGVGGDDRVGQVVVQLSSFSEGLESIRDAMAEGLEQLAAGNDTESEAEHAADESEAGPEAVEQLASQLDGVTSGLDQIRQAMSEGLERLVSTDASDQAPTPAQPDPVIAGHVAGLRESLDAIRDALEEVAARPLAVASAAAEPQDEEPAADGVPVKIVEPDDPDDEDGEEELDRIGAANTITVVNKIPPSLLKVLRQQFRLMEGWMEPLLKSSQAQQGEIQQLREQIETTLEDYERLIGQVRESKSKRSRARRGDS